MYREQVAKVLEAMNHMHMNETVTELTEAYGHCWRGSCHVGHPILTESLMLIVCRFNKETTFPEDALDMGYIVREPIINATFGDIRFRRYAFRFDRVPGASCWRQMHC